MEQQMRDFKGVWIPKEIWLDDRLNMLEKGIFTEIDSLDNGTDGCWASNEYIAEFCQCSPTKVSKAVSKLIDLGYVTSTSFDGRKRKLQSCLAYFARQTGRNDKAALQNMQESNIENNIENKYNTRKREPCDFSVGFDDFWKAYPRKVAKPNARKAWSRLKPNDDTLQAILKDIQRRKDGTWKDTDERFIPHPATYLNQRRWEDEGDVETEVEQPIPWWELPQEEIDRREQEIVEREWAEKKAKKGKTK